MMLQLKVLNYTKALYLFKEILEKWISISWEFVKLHCVYSFFDPVAEIYLIYPLNSGILQCWLQY